MKRNFLYVISAASGTGKTSLVKALLEKDAQLDVSISHTTRPQRPGEIDKLNYFFIDPYKFKELIEQNEFLEYATVFDHYYGTSKTQVLQKLQQKDVILEIDWQGANQIRKTFPEAITIFILPPSLDTLKQRLNKRGQDSTEVIARRLQLSCSEISHFKEFDYIVINDVFNEALVDLQSIIRAKRCDFGKNRDYFIDFVDELLNNS